MIHCIKVLFDVEINYPVITAVQIIQDLLHCIMCASVRSESIAVSTERTVINAAQHLRHCLLYHPVHDCRYTQRPLFAIGLGDIDPADWHRPVLHVHDSPSDCLLVLCKVIVQVFCFHAVHTCRAAVSLNPPDRFFQILITQNHFH